MAATMQLHLREEWEDLRRGRPGHRFQDRYERSRSRKRSGRAQRVFFFAIALAALAIGAVLSVFPGPAIPFFFVAGGLLATESRTIARFMDWCEVRLRKIFAWGKRHWRRLSTPARVITVTLFGTVSVTLAFVSYRLLGGGH